MIKGVRRVGLVCSLLLSAAAQGAVPAAQTMADQPAVPGGELGCYFILGSAGGLARNASTLKSATAKAREQAANARSALNWGQQWYLARLSTWPSDRFSPGSAAKAQDYAMRLRGNVTMAKADICMRWAIAVSKAAFSGTSLVPD